MRCARSGTTRGLKGALNAGSTPLAIIPGGHTTRANVLAQRRVRAGATGPPRRPHELAIWRQEPQSGLSSGQEGAPLIEARKGAGKDRTVRSPRGLRQGSLHECAETPQAARSRGFFGRRDRARPPEGRGRGRPPIATKSSAIHGAPCNLISQRQATHRPSLRFAPVTADGLSWDIMMAHLSLDFAPRAWGCTPD
jgi:hypothetical protein